MRRAWVWFGLLGMLGGLGGRVALTRVWPLERVAQAREGGVRRALRAMPERAAEQVEPAPGGVPAAAGPGGRTVGSPSPKAPSDSVDWELAPPDEKKAAPSPEELHPDLLLGALAMETVVRAAPSVNSAVLGHLRAGTRVRRAAVPAGRRGCEGGWYRVEPRGYVCVGPAATLDPEHPLLGVTRGRPDRRAGLPYRYGQSRAPAPPLYAALPDGDTQRRSEPDLGAHLAKGFGSLWAGGVHGEVPEGFAAGALLPRPFGYASEGPVYRGRALPRSAFSFTELFESGGRSYGLTTDALLVPLDRVTPVVPSAFSGVRLTPGEDLPVAFVRKPGEQLFGGDPDKGLRALRPVQFREGFRLSGRVVRSGGVLFRETASGEFLRDHERLLLVHPRKELPKPALKRRTFIEVSIHRQTLVAYEEGRPVLATLVSTGRDGTGDPETTHSTVQGFFLVHTKHVTARMSGDEADDEFDLRDVPYVQYFHEGYALHAAYWHDGFGTPRSHGCINLAPEDARFLFGFTDPPVPEAWHSAVSREGTLVYVHP